MDYKVTDTELTSVANAIRTKGGTSEQLTFPSDFITAIGNISGDGSSVNILHGNNAPTANLGSDGAIYLQHYNVEQITDISGFTKLYDSSLPYGDRGSKVATRLGITDETMHSALMNSGWNANGTSYYDSENKIGAYAGYDFGEPIVITMVKLWLGKYITQNNTLIVTLQTKDSEGVWNDITDLQIGGNISYPLNIFDVHINDKVYGVRWIHEKTPNKSGGNNITFYGMTLYTIEEGNDIEDAYLKVNGTWQNLFDSDIDDVNTGSDTPLPVDDWTALKDYIESSGTQYINTGYSPIGTTKFEVIADVPDNQTNYPCLIGERAYTAYEVVIYTEFNGGNLGLVWANGDGAATSDNVRQYYIGNKCKYVLGGDGLRGVLNANGYGFLSVKTVGTFSTLPIFIFVLNDNGTPNSATYCSAKLYRFRIYEGDTLVHEFVPWTDSNDVVCLKDTVTENLKYNAGTGVFTYGIDSQ